MDYCRSILVIRKYQLRCGGVTRCGDGWVERFYTRNGRVNKIHKIAAKNVETWSLCVQLMSRREENGKRRSEIAWNNIVDGQILRFCVALRCWSSSMLAIQRHHSRRFKMVRNGVHKNCKSVKLPCVFIFFFCSPLIHFGDSTQRWWWWWT